MVTAAARLPLRRAVAAAVALVLAATMSACAGAGVLPAPDVSAAGFGSGATGTVRLWVRAATQALSKPIVDSFNRTHPGLKVVMTAIPDTQYVTKLATAIRGRSVPDIVDVDDINSTLLAYHEAFTNLTTLIKQLPYYRQLSPGHLNLATVGGKIYAAPYAADVSVLNYNKALFARAGLDPNRPPTTLAQVLADARAISKLGGGIKGFSFGGNSPGIMGFTALPSVWASGARLFAGPLNNQRATIAGNTALVKTLRFYHDVWAQGLSQPSSRTESGATWGKDFLAGKVGIWPGNEGALVAGGITKSFAADIGVAPLPGAVSGSSVFDGGDNIAIPRGARNASGAWEFIRYALQKSQQGKLPTSGFTPIRADVLTPAFAASFPRTAVALKSLTTTGYAEKTLAYNTAINQVSGPWFALFTQAVFHGGVTAAVAAAQPAFANTLRQALT